MAIEVGRMEDDVFYADLNRQISLLIDDDHHDHHHYHHHHDHHHASFSNFPSVSPQIFTQSTPIMAPPQYLYQENCAREYLVSSKGTGVFIPQRPQLRRKSREQRKRAKSNTKQEQPYENYNMKGREY